MKNTKTWSYAAVTKKAEEKIVSLMSQSRVMAKHPDEARVFRYFAYGVFLAWNDLTMGWQDAGDSEKMEALTRKPDE